MLFIIVIVEGIYYYLENKMLAQWTSIIYTV